MVDVVVEVVEGRWEFTEPAFFGTAPEKEREGYSLCYRDTRPLCLHDRKVAGSAPRGRGFVRLIVDSSDSCHASPFAAPHRVPAAVNLVSRPRFGPIS